MNAGSIFRIVFIAVSGVLLFIFLSSDGGSGEEQPLTDPELVLPDSRQPYTFCSLKTDEFEATFNSRGAVLRSFELTSEKYRKNGEALNLSTTPQPGAPPEQLNDPNVRGDHEFRQQLFVQFRNLTSPGVQEDAKWNVAYDSVDWSIESSDGKSCVFTYADSEVELTKTIATTGRPYELSVNTSIKNVSGELRTHATAVDTVAWWLNEEVEAEMFRVSPYVTNVECVLKDGEAVRLLPDKFEPGDFDEPGFSATGKYGWFTPTGQPEFTSVSNAYFTHALVPLDDKSPACQLQIWNITADRNNPSAFYRARLAYPPKTLEAGAEESYEVLTYIGPKERKVLGEAAGGSHNLLELIDLGFFAAIAKILVSFLLKVYSVIPNWGLAIVVLTVCARILLFPLSIPGIRTMLKMREMRPELDKLAEKYKDDMQGRGQAQMKLMAKHGVGPVDQLKGCLPQIATMPVWFALYTTLQTAVELYNIPFLWFPDLSEPDPYFILPFVIGGTFFLQQKIMPMTGDPAQRKMMMYFMPGMFTVFMILLPSGLGVYMFTNSVLAIVQQQVVEWHAKRTMKPGEMTVTEKDDSPSLPQPKKRRRRRV